MVAGSQEDMDMIQHESIYRMHLLEGQTVTFWRDLPRFLDELCAAFPHQEKGIRGLYAEFKEFYDEMIVKNSLPLSPTERPPDFFVKDLLQSPKKLAGLLKILPKTMKYTLC